MEAQVKALEAALEDAREALSEISAMVPKGEVRWESVFYQVREIARRVKFTPVGARQ